MIKKCGFCGQWKDDNQFSTDMSRSTGMRGYCKICTNLKSHWKRHNITDHKTQLLDYIKANQFGID